jgi:hypothetical protein
MSFGPDDPYDDRERLPRRRYHPSDDNARWGDDRDDYDDGPGPTDPAEKVRTPGMLLLVIGILGVVLTVAVLVVLVVIAVTDPPRRNGELIFNVIFGAVFGAISLAYFVVMAIGAARMRQCRSYGLSMTAAILAISSIALLGLCSVFILPFGIWAVVVLAQADVKRAFDRRRNSYE